MTTWWALPTSHQETCWTTSLRPMATSHQSTWRSTSSTCAEHGIPSSHRRLSSGIFKNVLTIWRQGGVPIGHSHQINVGYANIFATGHFKSACRRWNEKPAAEKTWTHFRSHFAATRRQHKQVQIQGESAATAGYHAANAAMSQNE
jgi:hypothetical protein